MVLPRGSVTPVKAPKASDLIYPLRSSCKSDMIPPALLDAIEGLGLTLLLHT
jgi:hypothetical protein